MALPSSSLSKETQEAAVHLFKGVGKTVLSVGIRVIGRMHPPGLPSHPTLKNEADDVGKYLWESAKEDFKKI